MYRRFGKRLLDLIIAGIVLVLLSPVMAAIALLIRFLNGSPVIFRQERPGRYCKPFILMKFRTMRGAFEESSRLPETDRLTALGRFLRKTSLDELPELFNVIRGDMSLVGPRPLLTSYVPYYTDTEMHRHDVPPGLTGWTQINGRNSASWDTRLGLDVWYADRCSLPLDLRIILLTIPRVLFARGVHVDTSYAETYLDVERKGRRG
jgi:lipopolysaccharide/colanic/teichoic acid biosynthesis glycosyltransferase